MHSEISVIDNTLLDELNAPQREAVITTDQHCLVLAGAGTGKTRALTSRIAHLLQTEQAYPHEIMAVTFTNKAAAEMKERISKLSGMPTQNMWIGTFHSVSVKILRRFGQHIGLSSSFSIIDKDDQLRLVKQIIKEHNITDKLAPKAYLGVIDSIKNKGYTYADFESNDSLLLQFTSNKNVGIIFREYDAYLKRGEALDFNDLILNAIKLFKTSQEVQDTFIKSLKYIHVDEYQDTNVAQYLWLRLLAHPGSYLCCVGDDDQSIYGWRGADVNNILRFEKDFPNAKVIRLEQNYRSTHHILGAASQLIENNNQRLGKSLWTETDHPHANKVYVKPLEGAQEEASYVGTSVRKLLTDGVSASDIAILVRAGHQTRWFEERFLAVNVPHQVIGSMRFYDRAEIKDIIAYLRLINNHNDNLAFERALSAPKRGVGPAALRVLHDTGRLENVSLFDATRKLLETDELKPKMRSVLTDFTNSILEWRSMLDADVPLAEVGRRVMDDSGYRATLEREKSLEAESRLSNLKELESSLVAYPTLEDFIEHIALVNENSTTDTDAKVSIMTLHSAKGLEFNHVFLCGWEEGTFPNRRAIDESGLKGVEEERRLAYVGITRAKHRAVITHVKYRPFGGKTDFLGPSRFLKELKCDHVHFEKPLRGWQSNTANPYHFQHNPYRGQAKVGHKQEPDEYNQDYGNLHYVTDNTNPFAPGVKVAHKVYGEGEIIKVIYDKADVFFSNAGRKRVLTSFLEVVQDVSSM